MWDSCVQQRLMLCCKVDKSLEPQSSSMGKEGQPQKYLQMAPSPHVGQCHHCHCESPLPCRELMDKLYCCLLGHLYHLARGELLRLGSAMRLPEAAAAAKGSASILQLGKTAFAPASKASATAAASSPVRSAGGGAAQGGDTGSTAAAEAGSTTGKGGTAAAKKKAAGTLGGTGVDVLAEAAAAGTLSPRMVAQLQELLLMPLCGFSQMITKYADGSGSGLTYEVHTPKLGLDEVRE